MSLLISCSSRALTWGEDWQVKRERKTHLPKRKTHLPSLVAAATSTFLSVTLKHGTVSIIPLAII